MVKLNKSPLPEGVMITKEQDYRSDPLFGIIRENCYNKCYLCEEDGPSGLQVEHRIAHRGNKTLKYDWNNLFLSCYHCNHTKSDDHNNTLDCTQIDPEDYIALSMMPYPKERVIITVINKTEEAEGTAALLELVYNGEKTTILKAECENLRDRILGELLTFQQLLLDYWEEPDLLLKDSYLRHIKKMVARSSAFAAFKRRIIRINPTYRDEFGVYLA